MKKHNKYLILFFLSFLVFLQGCETTELEILDNPNTLGPDQADPALLFNNVQLSYKNTVASFNNVGGDLSRIEYMFGRVYASNYDGATFNGAWSNFYSGILPDAGNIEKLNTDGSLDYLVGASKAMEAHILMLLVDYIGDVVWSEANNPAEYPSPKLDKDSDVYQVALNLLNEATTLMDGASVGSATDIYYGGSATKWVKFINTLKMRAALTTGNYQAVVDATNVIESIGDNLVFEYGTQVLNPDTRHPDYITDYSATGAGDYRSNWLMNLMVGTIGSNGRVTGDDDPRRRYYFYRQSEVTPGNTTALDVGGNINTYSYPQSLGADSADGQTLVCSTQTVPTHLQFTPDEYYWCSLPVGYWGRTHGNQEGIPPDNFQRTASGVYPAGGRFDDNPDYVVYLGAGEVEHWGAAVGPDLGADGAGIEPLILSSFVEFWRAEAYLMLNDPTSAKIHFEAGITESINYVTSFGARDPDADDTFTPTEEKITDFIADTVSDFENAPSSTGLDSFGWPVEKAKMDILGEQFFVAMYGAGADGFNFIRRTGYPRTLARNIDDSPGTFPRSFLLPSNETGSNPNVSQKADLTTKVFWDSGVTNPAN